MIDLWLGEHTKIFKCIQFVYNDMEYPTCGNDYEKIRVHLNKSKTSHLPDGWPKCHDCGKWYKKIGTNWSMSDYSHPPITDKQHKIITGLLMGAPPPGFEYKWPKHLR
jgi:hypothetical protein